MKKKATCKKMILMFLSIIIFIRVGYIVLRGEIDKEYYTSAEYNIGEGKEISCDNVSQVFVPQQENLRSVDILFKNVKENRAGRLKVTISDEKEVIYSAKISLPLISDGEWSKLFVNAQVEPGKKYTISIDSSEVVSSCPSVFAVTDGIAPEISDSFVGDKKINGQIAIKYSYLLAPSVADRLVGSCFWVFIWICVIFLLKHIEELLERIKRFIGHILRKVKLQYLLSVTQFSAVFIILNSSEIEFAPPTRLIMYLITLISILNYRQKLEILYELIDRVYKHVCMFLLYFYAAFALVGQRFFVFPINTRVSFSDIFVYLVTVVWFIPIIHSLIYFIEILSRKIDKQRLQLQTWKFIVICIALLLIPAALNLYANNPGISSPDTFVSMVSNAMHIRGMVDWHPAFYCIILRAIQKIWNSTYAVIFVQYFFWTYVMVELMLFLRKKGIKENWLILVTFCIGMNSSNYLHINTIWKDIPYSLSLLWVLVIIGKLSIDSNEYKRKWLVYCELIIALVGVCLFRKNGIVSFLVIIVPLAMVLRKNMKLISSIVLSCALILIIKGPVYDYLDVKDSGHSGMYIGLSQDILGVYYAGGEISNDTLKMINVMTRNDNSEYAYTPTWSTQSYDLDVPMQEFILSYIDTFLKNPVMMIRAVLAREDLLWDIFKGKDANIGCVNYIETEDYNPEWTAVYPKRQFVAIHNRAYSATTYTSSSQWISAIEWRCGLLFLLYLVAFIYIVIKKGFNKCLVMMLPCLGQVLSLLLTTGWTDFRYFWPINLMNAVFILLTFVCVENSKNNILKSGDENEKIINL